MSSASDFVIENGILTEYKGSGGDVVIPEGVTSISSGAFIYYIGTRTIANTTVHTVSLPKSMRRIGTEAFDGCRELKEISIPSGVISIEPKAFRNCKKLTSITLPDTLETIWSDAFAGCERLRDIFVAEGSRNYRVVDELVLTADGKKVVLCPAVYSGACVIPDGVQSVDGFYDCKKLTDVTLPDSVRSVHGFCGCTNLTTINIPDGVESLYAATFLGCEKLVRLAGANVTTIENPAWDPNSKKAQTIFPLLFPKVALSKVRAQSYKIALTMGYVLAPDRHQGRLKASYQKYLDENRELILETAKRYRQGEVVAALEGGAATDVQKGTATDAPLEPAGTEKMSVKEAEALFELSHKTTGIKILRYKGNDTVVDVPLVVGKSNVTLVSPDAFSDDKIVRCSGKLFTRLTPQVQFNTYIAFQNGVVSFSAEQQTAMKDYFRQKQLKLLEDAVELQRTDMIGMLLELGKLKPNAYDSLLEKACAVGNLEITSIVTAAKNAAYTKEELETAETVATEKVLGMKERSLDDYKEIFKLSKRKDYVTNERWVLIRGCKKPQSYVEVPGVIDGMPVHLDRDAFNKDDDLAELVLQEGVAKIGQAALCGANLKTVHLPSTVCEIEGGKLGGRSLLEIDVSQDNGCYASHDGILYNKSFTLLLCCPAGKQGNVELPDGLLEIGKFAFSNCRSLTKIKIPATVTKIDSDAFAFAGKDEWTGSDYITIYPFTIHAPAGSYAETYAKENNIPFVAV